MENDFLAGALGRIGDPGDPSPYAIKVSLPGEQ
jgi:hypothetical protein